MHKQQSFVARHYIVASLHNIDIAIADIISF